MPMRAIGAAILIAAMAGGSPAWASAARTDASERANPVVALSKLLAERPNLAIVFQGTEPRAVSARRAEAYAEAGGLAAAAVAFEAEDVASERRLGPSFCRVALIRTHMLGVRTWRHTRQLDDVTVDRVVELALGGVELQGTRITGRGHTSGYAWCSCSVPLAAIQPIDMANRGDRLLAELSYAEGKRHVGIGDAEAAVEQFRRTRFDAAVFANALGFLVPLLADTAPDISASLASRFLDVDAIDDPDALAQLARHLSSTGNGDAARRIYDRCLDLAPAERECAMGRDRPIAAGSRTPLDYDTLVVR